MRNRLHIYLLPLTLLSVAPVAGQETTPDPSGATVRGVVVDSLAGQPLSEATVQLVPTGGGQAMRPRATVTDSSGLFAFHDVPDGSYLIGFLHPVLDSMALGPITTAVSVLSGRERWIELAVPGAAPLKRAYCGAQEGGGVIVGFVRTAQGGRPVPEASVAAEWRELTIGTQGIEGRTARQVLTTSTNGGFLFCGVPSSGSVRLVANHDEADTDLVEIDIPAPGLLRRDLYLGEARNPARDDTLPAADSIANAPRRTGPGRIAGTVADNGGRPVVGATVKVMDGEPVQADAHGAWELTNAPTGTRNLEVRAAGYGATRRVVDVADAAPSVDVVLYPVAELDTLRVRALSSTDRALRGFDERRRSRGMGRFLTAEDIKKLPIWNASDLFKYIPDLIQEGPQAVLVMRSVFGDGRCIPAVYLNGHLRQNLAPADVDALLSPKEIAAIEVYREMQVPPQFQVGMSGCGSIVIWTR